MSRTRMGTVWLSVCLSLTSMLLITGTLRADGVVRDGLGAIASGRGGANIAQFDNGAVLHDNPAGMVNMLTPSLNEISIDLLATDLTYTDFENPQGVDAETKPYPLPYISMIRKGWNEQWAFGLGVFAPAGFGAEYDLTNLTTSPAHSIYRYKSFGALAKVLPGVAYRVTDRLSIGGTLGVAISHAELESPFTVQTGPLAGSPTFIDLQASGAALTWSTGLQYRLTERTLIGVTYTSESRFRLDGNARAEVFGLGQSYYDLQLDLVWPRSLGAGLRHQFAERYTFSSDVIWYDWSEAFNQLDLKLSDPTNPIFGALLGPQLNDRFPLQWRDSVSARLGLERQLGTASVGRIGYVYHRNPVPTATLSPLIPGILEHAFSLGCGTQLGCGPRFDVAYQYSFGTPRSVGTSSILGGDFSNSRMEAQAHWLFLSLSQRY